MKIIYSLLCLLTVSQMFFYRDFSIRLDRYLLVLLTICAVLYTISKIRDINVGKIELIMFAFVVLIMYSHLTNESMIVKPENLLNAAFNISVIPFLIYFITKNIEYEKTQIEKYLKTIFVIGIYLSITAIAERYNLSFLIWPKYIDDAGIGIHYGRSRGPFLHSVFLGMNLIFAFCSSLVLIENCQNRIKRLAVKSILVLNMAGIYFTNTRSPWVSFILISVIYYVFDKNLRKNIIVLTALLSLVFVTGIASKLSIEKETLFSKRQNTVEDRYVNYEVAILMGMSNPLFGIGFGRMADEFESYYIAAGLPQFGGWDGNHNEFLGIFAELGIFAFILYISIFCILFLGFISALRKIEKKFTFERHFLISSMCVLITYILIANFSDIRSSTMHNAVAFAFFGISENIRKKFIIKK